MIRSLGFSSLGAGVQYGRLEVSGTIYQVLVPGDTSTGTIWYIVQYSRLTRLGGYNMVVSK